MRIQDIKNCGNVPISRFRRLFAPAYAALQKSTGRGAYASLPVPGVPDGSGPGANRSPGKRVLFRKGRRTQRICSFRGSYANRGNGMERSSSDVVHRGNPDPNRSPQPKRESPVRLPFRKGRRTQRICSFRGSYANRGNGMKRSSSDVVPVAGVEPARPCGHGILSPGRLPIPPHRHGFSSGDIIY